MSVRLKFRVESLNGNLITLSGIKDAVDSANVSIAASGQRPNARLTMTLDNPEAHDQFAPGQEWYADFTPATSEQAQTAGSRR